MCKSRLEEAEDKVQEIESLVAKKRSKLPQNSDLRTVDKLTIKKAVRGRICFRRHNNDDIIQKLTQRGERDIADLVRAALA